MNARNMYPLAAMLMFFICAAGAGQSEPPDASKEWPVPHSSSCKTTDYPLPGLTPYVNKVDGFQFKYPSALKTEGSSLEFENWTCVNFFHADESISMEVTLPALYQEPFQARGRGVSVDTRIFNQLKWMSYSAPGWATDCTFWKREQVCIQGGAVPSHGPLSDEIVKAMREIESTFVFSISDRMDSKIAKVKVGDRFGNLRVSRVVTREMAERNPRRSYAGSHVSYGEIDFIGSVSMKGGLEDFRTMNSGPDWLFSPDAEISSLLSCNLCKDLPFHVEFTNDDFGVEQNGRVRSRRFGPISYSYAANFSVVVNNISVIFSPGRSPSVVRANLVSIVESH